jgi:hypothetical protein
MASRDAGVPLWSPRDSEIASRTFPEICDELMGALASPDAAGKWRLKLAPRRKFAMRPAGLPEQAGELEAGDEVRFVYRGRGAWGVALAVCEAKAEAADPGWALVLVTSELDCDVGIQRFCCVGLPLNRAWTRLPPGSRVAYETIARQANATCEDPKKRCAKAIPCKEHEIALWPDPNFSRGGCWCCGRGPAALALTECGGGCGRARYCARECAEADDFRHEAPCAFWKRF